MKNTSRKLGIAILTATLWLAYTGCSSDSSSSSTGAGFIVSGGYDAGITGVSSTLNENFSSQFQVNLNESSSGAETTTDSEGNETSTSSSRNISGTFVFTGGTQCWNGGSISGSANGSNIFLTFSPDGDSANDIIFQGQQKDNNRIDGTFTANDSRICGAISGQFQMRRR